MLSHLVKTMYVEAAHRNPNGSAAEQRLHGHSYKIELLASGAPDEEVGWLVDFAELKKLFSPLYEQLDHAYLNEVPGMEKDTTVPGIERWILARLEPHPPWLDGVRVSIVGDCCLKIVPLPEDEFERLPARLRFTFEAAQSLPQLPGTHPCTQIHGHSYRIEVGAEDMDLLRYEIPALYETLDHQYLNDIPGLEASTVERIAYWIWEWLREHKVHPTAVVVQETPASRCIYYGE